MFDSFITNATSVGHPFDIVSFDFKKAFDKTPHEYVIQAASNIGINGKALDWLTSFLHGRTQKVRMVMDSFVDLGVERSSTVDYSLHYQNLVARACRAAGFIRRTFRIHTKKLLWPAFQYYVLPILMYAFQLWSPSKLKDIRLIEAVQRRFTKCICELRGLSYEERLRELHAFTLAKR